MIFTIFFSGSAKALATVTSIIDGTGSIGAAVGPFLAGWIGGMDNGLDKVFWMLIGADVVALLVSHPKNKSKIHCITIHNITHTKEFAGNQRKHQN